MPPKELDPSEKKIFEAIEKNDVALLRTLLGGDQNVNIFDENLMTPLQHAAYKGNKDIVQLLLDQGADPNICEHEHAYTALHFAGLSGNVEVCNLLLLAGAKSSAVNTVGRTPSQMAGFVGNHSCVITINNFIPKREVEYYTVPQGLQEKPHLPPFLCESFHKFISTINIHPIRVALNLQNLPGLLDHTDELKTVLELMCKKEMKGKEANEVMGLKFHYLGYVVEALSKIKKNRREEDEKKFDVVEVFAKKMLKPGKDNFLEFMDNFLKECIREFPFTECTFFRQLVTSMAGKDPPPALNVLTSAINGHRGFAENIPMCHTCGEEKPTKKCSKCKAVQYCDRNCQRLDWFVHKKACARLSQGIPDVETKPDPADISNEIQNLLIGN